MRKEVKIGLLSIVSLGLVVWGYNYISGRNLFSNDIVYHTYFNDVSDVNSATQVQINGYPVGVVTSIDPDPNDLSRIKVTYQVKNEIGVPLDAIAELRPSGATGGKYLELVFDRMCDGSNCATKNCELKGKSVGLLSSLIPREELSGHADVISDALRSNFDALGKPSSDAAIDQILYRLSNTMGEFEKMSVAMNSVIRRIDGPFAKTLENFEELSSALVNNRQDLEDMVRNMNTVTTNLAKVNLDEPVSKAKDALNQSTQTLKTLEARLVDSEASLKEFKTLLGDLNEGEGTFGKLLKDPNLYNNLDETLRQTSLLVQDLRLNPKRYVNVSVFGKKSKSYSVPHEDPAAR